MRTDSVNLSEFAIDSAKNAITSSFGANYHHARRFKTKTSGAQEAHEAIRPTDFNTTKAGEDRSEERLYELIWKRAIASQMSEAQIEKTVATIGISKHDKKFVATGEVILFDGFLKVYMESSDDETDEDTKGMLPPLKDGQVLTYKTIDATQRFTQHPPRYTEASLIKELEDREIGRPSTYASIIGTILNRGYVYKKGTALVPAWLAFSVIRLLEEHFSRLVSYEFTAQMEDVLDEVAAGRADRNTELAKFYFGTGDVEGLKKLVSELGEIDARELATFPIGEGINLRVGRYGPYVEDEEQNRGNVPEDLPPDELTVEKAKELLANPAGEETHLGTHPETGLLVVAKNGRFGPYVTEELPEDAPKSAKPRTGSLFKSMSLDTVTLDDAVKLISLPRVVGVGEDGEEITAQNGRYGPYVSKGKESRSLESAMACSVSLQVSAASPRSP